MQPQAGAAPAVAGASSSLRTLAEIYAELGQALLQAGIALSAKGHAMHAAARYNEAAAAFERGIKEGGLTRRLGLGLAEARERQRRFEDAVRIHLQVIRVDPESAAEILERIHGWLTEEIARALGPWLDAEWMPELERLSSPPAAVFGFVGRISLYRGKHAVAIDAYRAALRTTPGDVFALEGLGEALFRTGALDEAVSVLARAVRASDALEHSDRVISTRRRLGAAHVALGNYPAGIRVLREGLALAPGGTPELWTALVRGRLGLERPEGAVRAAERAIGLKETYAPAHAVISEARLRQGKHLEAVTAAETALTTSRRIWRPFESKGASCSKPPTSLRPTLRPCSFSVSLGVNWSRSALASSPSRASGFRGTTWSGRRTTSSIVSCSHRPCGHNPAGCRRPPMCYGPASRRRSTSSTAACHWTSRKHY
jgi:tetratricopeptide (TPR) repeat protein